MGQAERSMAATSSSLTASSAWLVQQQSLLQRSLRAKDEARASALYHISSLGASGAVNAVVMCSSLLAPRRILPLFFVLPVPAGVLAGLFFFHGFFRFRRLRRRLFFCLFFCLLLPLLLPLFLPWPPPHTRTLRGFGPVVLCTVYHVLQASLGGSLRGLRKVSSLPACLAPAAFALAAAFFRWCLCVASCVCFVQSRCSCICFPVE